jgi:hypothetical protein
MLHKAQAAICHQLATSASSCKSFKFTFVLRDKLNEVNSIKFETVEVFNDTFRGFYFMDPNTCKMYSYKALPKIVDPAVVYIADHPFLTTRLEERSHNQITDKAFEEKACQALEHHLKHMGITRRVPENASRPDGWRILSDKQDVAEWEGIWERGDGHFCFLEAKHFMDFVSDSFIF